MSTDTVRTGLVEANGTQLYHEIRGDGPPVVCITGAGGDAGDLEGIAELLADTYTVVTYDRRGLSRSPAPTGWTQFTIDDQAADCAALIEALGLDRPIVFGTSLGGTIIVRMLERDPRCVRGAILHEPGLPSVSPSSETFQQEAMAVASEAMSAGANVEEAFARWFIGDAASKAHSSEMRTRRRANQGTQSIEMAAVATFVPDEAAIATVDTPVHVAVGEDTRHEFLVEGARWVSTVTGARMHTVPGTHAGYLADPRAFADALRPILEELT